ncbi:MAG: glycogen synthase [Polyangiaceae bacterium]
MSDARNLHVALVSREYPPEVYGGAGVHVEYLARELRRLARVRVECFGRARNEESVRAHPAWDALAGNRPELAALRTMSTDLLVAAGLDGVDLVHTHTWYANFAGHLAKLLYAIPHVMTSHSLEPLRPWKEEQLAGGYRLSCFIEKLAVENADAVIGVSRGMKADILSTYPQVRPERVHVIHNGIDPDEYRPTREVDVLARYGIDPEVPYVVFVGRVTRQKGVVHLLSAARHFTPGTPLVLCAGEPDTPEIAREVRALVAELEARNEPVIWIEQMLARPEVIQILSHARVFVCPSVYEPFGIVNVEAMACGVPVVASKVGGIPEIVDHEKTGYLVDFEPVPGHSQGPRDPERFARDLAAHVNRLLADAALAQRMGENARKRALGEFSWAEVAKKTVELYASLLPKQR